MPTFIKTGFWEKLSKAPKEYLNLDNLIQSIGGGGTSYKKYVALLNQEGENAPVATVLENTLGFDIIWTRDSIGYYLGSTSGLFINPLKVTFNFNNSQNPFTYSGQNNNVDEIYINTYNSSTYSSLADNILYNAYLEIRVYP